mmetsp:Transcript_46461/g.56282  ORF Transcript_46461/g.56282 Transcript_46461/m.56282 type:complete len:93 (-) Transcript_46461:233-511(-)
MQGRFLAVHGTETRRVAIAEYGRLGEGVVVGYDYGGHKKQEQDERSVTSTTSPRIFRKDNENTNYAYPTLDGITDWPRKSWTATNFVFIKSR